MISLEFLVIRANLSSKSMRGFSINGFKNLYLEELGHRLPSIEIFKEFEH